MESCAVRRGACPKAVGRFTGVSTRRQRWQWYRWKIAAFGGVIVYLDWPALTPALTGKMLLDPCPESWRLRQRANGIWQVAC